MPYPVYNEDDDEADYAETESPNARGDLWGYHDYELPRTGFWGATKGALEPGHERKGILYFGVENELDLLSGNVHGTIQKFHDDCPPIWTVAEDASLPGLHGAEFISDPMTLEAWQLWARQNTEYVWPAVNPTRAYGMHVHVSRAPLTPLTCAKLDFAMYRCQPQFMQFARRGETSYCQQKESHPKGRDWQKTFRSVGRYGALSFTPHNTIEFRLFRATRKVGRLLARVEFCHALVTYCRQASIHAISWEDFRAWVRPQQKRYGALLSEMACLSLIEERK